MIEIGTGTGDSTEIFSMFFDTVYTVDPMLDKADAVNSKEVCREIFEGKIKGKRVFPTYGFSHDYVNSAMFPGMVDMVYIDGNHAYPFVKKDIQLYWPVIRENGFLCGHDYGVTLPGQDGVRQAVDECFGNPDLIYIDTSWVVKKTAERKILC
jgi:hypothetical protein